ncbi:MAG: hypothetical protein Q8P31_00955 [Bacillota bacterium]|nr:hypothetical protein [Bacillota bacterium]
MVFEAALCGDAGPVRRFLAGHGFDEYPKQFMGRELMRRTVICVFSLPGAN